MFVSSLARFYPAKRNPELKVRKRHTHADLINSEVTGLDRRTGANPPQTTRRLRFAGSIIIYRSLIVNRYSTEIRTYCLENGPSYKKLRR